MPTTYTIEIRPDGTGVTAPQGPVPWQPGAYAATPPQEPPKPPKAPPLPAPQSPPPPPPKPKAPPLPAGDDLYGRQQFKAAQADLGDVREQMAANQKMIDAMTQMLAAKGIAAPPLQAPQSAPPLPALPMPSSLDLMDEPPLLPADALPTPQEQPASNAKPRPQRPPAPPQSPPPPPPPAAGGYDWGDIFKRRPRAKPAREAAPDGPFDWESIYDRPRAMPVRAPAPPAPLAPPTAAPDLSNPFRSVDPPAAADMSDPRKAQTQRANEIRAQQNRDNQLRKEEAEAKNAREEKSKAKAEESRAGLQNMMNPLADRMPAGLKPLLGAFGGKGGMLGGLADAAAGGAGMGGVGGMAGMAKLAGGPIGLALMAKDAIHAVGDKARQSLESAGDAAVKLARNDMTALGDGLTGMGDAVGKVSPVFGELIKTAGTLVNVQQRAAQAFIDRGKELSKFSGPLAAANAQADIKRMQADMKEAQVMGKSLARLTEQQNRAEIAFRDAILPIKEAIVRKLTVIAERSADFLEAHGRKLDTMVWIAEAVLNVIVHMNPLLNIGQRLLSEVTDVKKKMDKPAEIQPPIDEWLGALRSMGPGFQRNNPEGPRANLNAPIHDFGGN